MEVASLFHSNAVDSESLTSSAVQTFKHFKKDLQLELGENLFEIIISELCISLSSMVGILQFMPLFMNLLTPWLDMMQFWMISDTQRKRKTSL